MIACPHCGSLNEATALICTACGKALAGAYPSSVTSQPIPVPEANAGPPPLRPPLIPARQPSEQRSGIAAIGLSAMTAVRPQPPIMQTAAGATSAAKPAAVAEEPISAGYCLVCGLMLPPPVARQACPRCTVPRGGIMDPNDVTSSNVLHYSGYAPPITAVHPLQYTSQRSRHGESAWNWGAAICSTWWAFRHRCWIWAFTCLLNLLLWVFVVVLIPSNSIGDSIMQELILLCSISFWLYKTIYLGSNGNRLAMKNGCYEDEARMRASLHKWNVRGGLIGGLFLAFLFCEVLWNIFR